jgi:hypothetical protein
MKLTSTLGTLALLIATCAPVIASAVTVEDVVAKMTAQGYTNIAVKKTFLGRTKIEGRKGGSEREVVLNTDGEVLRNETEHDGSDWDDNRANDDTDEQHGNEAEDDDAKKDTD